MKNPHLPSEASKDVLRRILLRKIEINPRYSARAFARDLGVSAAFVTNIFNGKKRISFQRAVEASQTLNLTEDEKQSLLQASLIESGLNLDVKDKLDRRKFIDLSEEQFKLIASWQHYAILDLTTTQNFKSNTRWIAKRLKIIPLEVDVALARLQNVGLLTKKNGVYVKTNTEIEYSTKVSSAALREHHRQMMDRAKEELKQTDQKSFEERLICSVTFAANTKKIAEAKKRISQFQQELAHFMSEDNSCGEVFQLNIQFFSHSKEIA